MSGGESSSTSNTLHSTPPCKYDVFLSFAGQDTRLTFTGHLYEAFTRSGITCFRDDLALEKGEDINSLFQAIKNSLCAVLVISRNYAKSKWCLDELEEILESREKLGRRIFPIFYNVDPADVRGQHGSFGEAFAELEKKLTEDTTNKAQYSWTLAELKKKLKENKTKVQKWRTALLTIGKKSGWVTKDKHEVGVIKDVVEKVRTYVSAKLPYDYDENLVGIESRVRDMEAILENGLDDKYVVGIWGMGGVGKTTLARVVYEKISYKFDFCCFIENVRDTLQKGGLVSLLEKLLSDLKIKEMNISDESKGMKMIRDHLSDRKVLLVLDDVDDMNQLENLVNSLKWFGQGSRILITTRDSHVLNVAEAGERMYDMKAMNTDESLRLFSNKAFKKDHPEEGYWELSKSVVEYAGGLPLALRVLGLYLRTRSRDAWRDVLDKLKQIPNNDILQKLKISYDGLDEDEKTIFLDIACFFRGWLKKEVIHILNSCGLHSIIGIQDLIGKALLVETKDCTLEMHDLIEELGRHIVHQESPKDVCKRSRLWEFKDIKDVLENNKGSEAIQAIAVTDMYRGRIKVHPEVFSKMSSIRLLWFKDWGIGSPLILRKGFKLPGTLKVVQLPSFPVKVHPLETPLNELVSLKMPSSRIKQLCNVIQARKLKFIDLSHSESLIETPDFSEARCLEHLCLFSCISLVKVHDSLGKLKELVEVDLNNCIKLKSLPSKLKTNRLVKLDLGGCWEVEVLPKFRKSREKLSYLDVSSTAITGLSNSFGSLIALGYLNLGHCKIGNLDKLLKVMPLTELYLSWCGLNDGSIPHDFGSLSTLIVLDLSHNDFVNLPTDCFTSLFRLHFLSLDGCTKLKSLPRLPPWLIRLNASHCCCSIFYSMEPFSSDGHLWDLVASLDHEHRGQSKYVISGGKYDDAPSMCKHSEVCLQLEHLPLEDFFATAPGCKIPSWFPNKHVPSSPSCEHEIEVKIPPCLRDREWSGIVVCLRISDDFHGYISWSSKAPKDDDYIRKERAHDCVLWSRHEGHPHLCIMVLKLDEKTCWQYLKAGDNSLHIKLYTHNYYQPPSTLYIPKPAPMSEWECGWRVICKEEIQEWCLLNHFNQLTPPQLDPPHDEIKLPSRLLEKLYGSANTTW